MVELPNHNRIVIETKSPKIKITVTFSNNEISYVKSMPDSSKYNSIFTLKMNRENVRESLVNELSNSSIYRIYNFTPGTDWIDLRGITEFDWDYLLKSDEWNLEEKDEYSSTKLNFANNLLRSIDYYWTPIELP